MASVESQDTKTNRAYTRRDFLVAFGAGCAALAVGWLPGCATVPVYRGNVRDGSLSLSEAEFATTSGDQNALVIRAPQMESAVILLRLPDASYRALSAVCTHQGCEVRPGSNGLRCPCHGSAFSLEGEVLRGPAKKPLPVYPVRVADGQVTIDVRSMELR